MTSPEGIDWTERPAIPRYWMSVCWGDGLFVAVSYDGACMTSPDGINWTERTPISGTWTSICYGNGLFVAVGYSDIDTLVDFYEQVLALKGNYNALLSQVGGNVPVKLLPYAEIFPHRELTRAKVEFLDVALHSATRHMASSYGSGMFFSVFGGTTRYEPFDDDSNFWLDGKVYGAVLGEAYVAHSANNSVRYGLMLGCGSNRVDFAGESIALGVKNVRHNSYFAAVTSHFDHITKQKKRMAINLLCCCSKGRNTSTRINGQNEEFSAKFNDFGGTCLISLSQNIIRFGAMQFGPWFEGRYDYIRHKKYEEVGSANGAASLEEVSQDIGIGTAGINLEFGQPSVNPDLKSRLFIRAGYETKQKQRNTTAAGTVNGMQDAVIAKVKGDCTNGKVVAEVGAKTSIGRQCELGMRGGGKFSKKEYASGSIEISLTCLF